VQKLLPVLLAALGLSGFVAHSLQTKTGMRVIRASPEIPIAASKIGIIFCTDP